MAKSIKNKIALITGGSKGIGLRIAEILAKKNYDVVICSRTNTDLIKAKKKLESYNIRCLTVKADVSNYAQCRSLVRNVIKKFSRIDLLVNNAGIQGPIGKLWQNNLNEWKKAVDINLMGTIYMSHLVIPYMLKQKSGIVLNLSGGGAAYPRPFFSAYACSKTAVVRLTEILSQELKGTNIKVYAVAPGATWTNMTKNILLKEMKVLSPYIQNELNILKKSGGTPIIKLKELIIYLLSKDSKRLSGKLIHVDELNKIAKIAKLNPSSGLLRRINYS